MLISRSRTLSLFLSAYSTIHRPELLSLILPAYSTTRIVLFYHLTFMLLPEMFPFVPFCSMLSCMRLIFFHFCLYLPTDTFLYSSPVYYARLWGSRDGQEWPQGSSALTDIDTLSQADSRLFPGISHASLENLQGLSCSLPTILLPFCCRFLKSINNSDKPFPLRTL